MSDEKKMLALLIFLGFVTLLTCAYIAIELPNLRRPEIARCADHERLVIDAVDREMKAINPRCERIK